MKPTKFSNGRLLLVMVTIALTIGLISWDHKQSPRQYDQATQDTVPKKSKDREKKIRDLDDVLEELENTDIDIEWEKARKEIAEAMKNVNSEKIRLNIEHAMKDVDMANFQKEIEQAMSSVNMEEIRKEITEAMKGMDVEKINAEVKAALASVDMKKIQEELKKVKEIDMKEIETEMAKVQEELKKVGPELEKSMSKAKEEIEKAKSEVKEFKGFVDGLDRDGLINKKENYSIKHKNGVLEVNGKKVSPDIYNKNRTFLEKHDKFSIEKTKDDFDFDND